MQNFLTAYQNAKKLTRAKVRKDANTFFKILAKELEAFNRSTLFNDSEDVFGKPIGFYSAGTEIMTNGRKRRGEPFDLKETGVFLESITVNVVNGTFFFRSTDPKLNEVLSNLLTDDILGIQDDDLQKVINNRILPFFINYYTHMLF